MKRAITVLGVMLVAMLGVSAQARAGGPSAPPNDNFAGAQLLSNPADVAGSNAGATRETNEPAHAERTSDNTVWFEYQATSATPILIETCGSSFDTVLAVYTGTSVGSLTPVVSNDDRGQTCNGSVGDQGGAGGSAVRFTPVPQTFYKIAVAGFLTGQTGTIDLDLKQGPIPANDNFADATPLSGSSVDASANNVSASKEVGEPSHASSSGGASIWYSWTAPAPGEYAVDTCGSSFNTVLAVYTGTEVDALTGVASNNNSSTCGAGSAKSMVPLTATASNQVFKIAVDSPSASLGVGPAVGSVELRIRKVGPPNDRFDDREELTGASDSFTGSNAGATLETGEPNHSGQADSPAIRSTWFDWTPPSDGFVTFSLCSGAPADSVLAVYLGTTVANLTPVPGGRDDDGCGSLDGLSGVADLPVYEGLSYRVAVAAKGPSGLDGPYTLDLSFVDAVPPANDNLAGAKVLSGNSDSFSGNNIGATTEPDEPDLTSGHLQSARSVWFQWVAPDDGQLTVGSCDSPADSPIQGDSVLGVFTGSTVNGLALVASDDDGCGTLGGHSSVTVTAVEGTSYRIALADYAQPLGMFGPYDLDLSFVPDPPTQECLDAQADLAEAETALEAAEQRVAKAKAALKKAKKSKKASKIKKAKAKLKAATKARTEAEDDVTAAEAAVTANCD